MIRRLGIIGDLHGEHDRLADLLDWFGGQSVDRVICTGDIADGRGCLNRSCELLREGSVETVAGNHDRWMLEDKVRHLENAHSRTELTDDNRIFMESLPRSLRLETICGPLLLCHGVADNDLARVWPGRNPGEIRRSSELDDLIADDDYRFVINGHMHFRMLIDFDRLLLMNAGTLMGDHAGVSIIDFEGGWISVFHVTDDRVPERHVEQALAPTNSRPIWKNSDAFDGTRTPITLDNRQD